MYCCDPDQAGSAGQQEEELPSVLGDELGVEIQQMKGHLQQHLGAKRQSQRRRKDSIDPDRPRREQGSD